MKEQINEEIILAISAAIAALETRPGYKLVVDHLKEYPKLLLYGPLQENRENQKKYVKSNL